MIPILPLRQRFLEREIADIKSFHTKNNFDPGEDEENLKEHFEMFYELEYKYHAIKNNEFTGNPARKINLLAIIEEKAKEIIESIAGTFEDVYAEWLEVHAITDPKKWATARVKDAEKTEEQIGEEGEAFDSILLEYAGYKYGNDFSVSKGQDKAFREILESVIKNINKYPSFKEFIIDSYLPGEKADKKEILKDDGLENFNSS